MTTRKSRNRKEVRFNERKFSPHVIQTIQSHYRNGYSMETIARVMAISISSVSKHCRGIERGHPPVEQGNKLELIAKPPVVPIAPNPLTKRPQAQPEQNNREPKPETYAPFVIEQPVNVSMPLWSTDLDPELMATFAWAAHAKGMTMGEYFKKEVLPNFKLADFAREWFGGETFEEVTAAIKRVAIIARSVVE